MWIDRQAHTSVQREHTGIDQLVVGTPLLLIQIGVQHAVRLVLFGEHPAGVPIVAERFENGTAPACLVQAQVAGACQVGVIG